MSDCDIVHAVVSCDLHRTANSRWWNRIDAWYAMTHKRTYYDTYVTLRTVLVLQSTRVYAYNRVGPANDGVLLTVNFSFIFYYSKRDSQALQLTTYNRTKYERPFGL